MNARRIAFGFALTTVGAVMVALTTDGLIAYLETVFAVITALFAVLFWRLDQN